jgi:hypothetical protein
MKTKDNQNYQENETEDQMTDQHSDNLSDDDDQDEGEPKPKTPEFEKIVAERVKSELAKMKSNMDKIAKERDEAVRAMTRQQERERELKAEQLEKDGKVRESLEMKLTAEKERVTLLTEKLDKLTRDRVVSDLLRNVEFRTPNAAKLAEQAILSELTKTEEGSWIHQSGASVSDYIKAFLADEDNEYLLKPKKSSGTGAPQASTQGEINTSTKRPKSLRGIPASKVLEMARQGLLG